jgi:predicted metal-dependent HD superfamily phosphohydrolase
VLSIWVYDVAFETKYRDNESLADLRLETVVSSDAATVFV